MIPIRERPKIVSEWFAVSIISLNVKVLTKENTARMTWARRYTTNKPFVDFQVFLKVNLIADHIVRILYTQARVEKRLQSVN